MLDDVPSPNFFMAFRPTCADNPKFLAANPGGFAARNFGYPLLYGVPRSGMEYGSGGIRACYSQWSGAELRITLLISEVFAKRSEEKFRSKEIGFPLKH